MQTQTQENLNVGHEQKDNIIRLLKLYGSDSLSYFHLQESRRYYFSPSGNSFLSYRIYNKIAIVGGDPLGLSSEITTLLISFITYLQLWSLSPCFVGLSGAYKPIVSTLGLKVSKIGEEAVLKLENFERNKLKKKVRRAVRHVEKLEVDIFFMSPKDLSPYLKCELEAVSSEWLKKNGKRGKRGFSMTLNRLPTQSDNDCQIAIAVKNNKVLGFLSFTPIYQKSGLSLDLSRQRTEAPNGLNEFLIIKSAEYFKKKSVSIISLNFAAFSNILESSGLIPEKIATFSKKLLSAFYRSHNLRVFNEKFLPSWESRYVAYGTFLYVPLYILALARADG